jgi:hypothetical protein
LAAPATFDPRRFADHRRRMNAFEEVRLHVVRASGSHKVLPQSRLWHDLRVGGDDAWELIEKLVDSFGTSFTSMAFSDFFPDETEAFGAHWGMVFGFRSDKTPVTVQHLADVVERGHWFDPPTG